MENETLSVNPENVLSIMLATDNHLGYNEKDSHRGTIKYTNICKKSELDINYIYFRQ